MRTRTSIVDLCRETEIEARSSIRRPPWRSSPSQRPRQIQRAHSNRPVTLPWVAPAQDATSPDALITRTLAIAGQRLHRPFLPLSHGKVSRFICARSDMLMAPTAGSVRRRLACTPISGHAQADRPARARARCVLQTRTHDQNTSWPLCSRRSISGRRKRARPDTDRYALIT